MIQGHGNSNPLAFFIADGASGEDLKTNYALSGYQEAVLKGFCKDVGIHYDSFYRTALIKNELPAKANADGIEECKKLLPQYGPILIDEINTLNPNLLIPLGELSFQYLTGLSGIRKFRGSVVLADDALNFQRPIKVMPILGPNPYLYQEYSLRYITRIDFGKIHKYWGDALIPDKVNNIWVARSASALRTFLERSYSPDGLLVFDIETYLGIITCISFCFNGIESVCIPFIDSSIDRDNRMLMQNLVARILVSPIKKVNQNIKYDWKILERWGFKVNNIVGDTMLAASTLFCEFPKKLGFLTSIYTDMPYFKDEGKEFDPSRYQKDRFYLYNAKDSLATHQIYTQQIEEMQVQGVMGVYQNLMTCLPIYKTMEENGIRIDDSVRQKLYAKYESLYRINVLKLKRLLNVDYINPLSSKQMHEVVFDTLKFKKIRGVKGADEDSLEILYLYGEALASPIFGKEILKVIIACRKIHKVIEILDLHCYPDGYFRCEYNLAGTETGRSTAGKSLDQLFYIEDGKVELTRLGHSLQTIGKHGFMIDGRTYGKDIRDMFVPSHGYVFIEPDLSQAEARVDAILANNPGILNVFDGPVGIHRLTGSWVYGCPPEEIKKNDLVDGVDRYHMAKTVRHAGERNIKANGLAILTTQPIKNCQLLLDKFHANQPEIREVFHRDIITAINTTHCLIAPNGRRRDFFDRIDNHTYNEGISFIPQAVVSDQVKFSLPKTLSQCPWARLLAESHDGTLAEVPIGRAEEYGSIYKKNVETPINFKNCSLSRDYELIIPCEVSVGDSWASMKEIKL